MVGKLQADPAAILTGFGAEGRHVDELLRYNENVFRTGEERAAPLLPLPDEPFVAFWRRCVVEASELGSLAVLRAKLPQLRFPIRAGIGNSAPYHAATRRGVYPELLPAATGLPFRHPERLEIVLHPSAAGTIPLLISRCREDFVSLVQALSRHNEPWPVPESMGALMVSGYLNWERLRELRQTWDSAAPAARESATWAAEMSRLRHHQDLYHDRFILLSDGPYSAVPAAEVGLAEAEWRELSLSIRREHECTHYFTRRLFGAMRNNLLDELIADYVGVAATMGRLRPDWLVRFLGLERQGPGARLEIYRGTPPLSEGAWVVLRRLARAAVANLAHFDAVRQPDLSAPRARALVIIALASLRLEDLAAGASAVIESAHDRAMAWAGGAWQAPCGARAGPPPALATVAVAAIRASQAPPNDHRQAFAAVAAGIVHELVAAARRSRGGDVYWLGPEAIEDGGVAQLPLGPYLYPGVVGVALFLAAAARQGVDGSAALCRAAIAPLRREIAGLRAAPLDSVTVEHLLGGLSGLGSLVYALVRLGDLLGDAELFDDAHFLTNFITAEAIARDDQLDVMFGAAGALLALLALDDRLPEANRRGATPLALAARCGQHLLHHRATVAGGRTAWINGLSGQAVGGFAHGSAGIACALLRLYRRTGDEDLRLAARSGIDFERGLYVAERGDWRMAWRPDARFVNSWCNGAPGIAVGRIGGLAGYDDDSVRVEIERAMERTADPVLEEADHLCCGNMGRIEVLMYAARALVRPDLLAVATRLGGRVVARARERGGFGLMPSCAGVFDPRFFLGVTGIGYSLLRLSAPDGLPCLVALE